MHTVISYCRRRRILNSLHTKDVSKFIIGGDDGHPKIKIILYRAISRCWSGHITQP